MKKSLIALIIILNFVHSKSQAQCYTDATTGKKISLTGGPCVNTVVSSVPFLRIAPDARSGAMGDAGIALTPDANSLHFNASNLAFSNEDLGVSATYTPWLSALGIQDIYLAYAAAFKKINKRQTVGASIKYFSLGEISFTDDNGSPTGMGSPNELETSLTFIQQLSPKLSAAVTGKFIYSNLATGQSVGGNQVKAGKAGAADISFTYKTPIKTAGGKNDLTIGLALTNIGSKISYTSSVYRDYLPANMGLGASYKMKINNFNTVLFALDFNKLMVPTPVTRLLTSGDPNPEYNKNGDKDNIPDYKEKALVSSIFSSFADAPVSEELQEFTISAGAEYWYDNQFAVRAGFFHEDKLKGGRNYATIGMGLKYNIFGLNFSYLIPTSAQRTPLDNTLRFSMLFDFGAFKADED